MKIQNDVVKLIIADGNMDTVGYLKQIFEQSPDFRVIGSAAAGAEIMPMISQQKPDAVLLGIDSPGLDIYETTIKIMEVNPLPIILLVSRKSPTLVVNSFRAMRAGAMSVVDLPDRNNQAQAGEKIQKLLHTVRKIARVGVSHRGLFKEKTEEPVECFKKAESSRPAPPISVPMEDIKDIRLIAIGASTGGPAVIRCILSKLNPEFSLPILIVQHIAPGFLKGMINWLSHDTCRTIIIPQHKERIYKSHVYFAPDHYHMGVNRNGTIALEQGPNIHGVKPSVSFLFHSLAESYGNKTGAVLLTGMGVDGAEELNLIKQKGGLTIAQDETSSVVHGMPGEAIRLHAAKYVMPPIKIVQLLNMVYDHG